MGQFQEERSEMSWQVSRVTYRAKKLPDSPPVCISRHFGEGSWEEESKQPYFFRYFKHSLAVLNL